MAENEFNDIKLIEKGTGTAVAEARPKIKRPYLYKVLLLNDDFTPMDFVVEVLINFFHIEQEKAEQIMWKVHKEGKAVCGIFTKDVAETKATQVNEYSRSHSFPLLCVIEPDK